MIKIREVGQEWSGVLADIIRQSFKHVALRFLLNQENSPTHPSNCTIEWIREDFGKGKRFFILFKDESGCKKFDHLPFEVLFLYKEMINGSKERDS